MGDLTGIPEFAQVSIIRYNAMMEHTHLLEMRMVELENHIDKLEKFLTDAYYEDVSRHYVSIDKDDIKELLELEGEE